MIIRNDRRKTTARRARRHALAKNAFRSCPRNVTGKTADVQRDCGRSRCETTDSRRSLRTRTRRVCSRHDLRKLDVQLKVIVVIARRYTDINIVLGRRAEWAIRNAAAVAEVKNTTSHGIDLLFVDSERFTTPSTGLGTGPFYVYRHNVRASYSAFRTVCSRSRFFFSSHFFHLPVVLCF